MLDFILCNLNRPLETDKNNQWILKSKQENFDKIKCGWCQGKLTNKNWYTSGERYERHGFCSPECDMTFFKFISIRKHLKENIFVPFRWKTNYYFPQCSTCKKYFTPRDIVKGKLLSWNRNKNSCVKCFNIGQC